MKSEQINVWIGVFVGFVIAVLIGAPFFCNADAQVIRAQGADGSFPFVQADNAGVLKIVTASGDTLLVWEPKLTIVANQTKTATTSLDSVVYDPVLVQVSITAVDDASIWINSSAGDAFPLTAHGVWEWNTGRYAISKVYFQTATGTSSVTISGSTE